MRQGLGEVNPAGRAGHWRYAGFALLRPEGWVQRARKQYGRYTAMRITFELQSTAESAQLRATSPSAQQDRVKEGLRSDTNKHQGNSGNASVLPHNIVQRAFIVSYPRRHFLLHRFHGQNLNPHIYRVAHIKGHMFYE